MAQVAAAPASLDIDVSSRPLTSEGAWLEIYPGAVYRETFGLS